MNPYSIKLDQEVFWGLIQAVVAAAAVVVSTSDPGALTQPVPFLIVLGAAVGRAALAFVYNHTIAFPTELPRG